MKIYNDILQSLNESPVHVRVLSTYDFMKASRDASDIVYLLDPMQADHNETLHTSELHKYTNVNGCGINIPMEDSVRMQKLREKGNILGADEYYEEAYLPIKDLSYAVYRGEPVVYNDRDDIRTIHTLVHMFLDDYIEKHGSVNDVNAPLYIKCLVEYVHHIDAMYHTYFGQFEKKGAVRNTNDSLLFDTIGGLNAAIDAT